MFSSSTLTEAMNTNGLETERAARPRVSCCHITQVSGEKAADWTLSQGCLPGWVRTGPRGLGHLEDQEQNVGKTRVNRPTVSVLAGGEPGPCGGSARPARGGGRRLAAEERPATPKAAIPAPPHLHVGHKALLDPPAVFIDLVQELQLIVVAATHGGEGGCSSRLEEKPPRNSPAPRSRLWKLRAQARPTPPQEGGRQAPRLKFPRASRDYPGMMPSAKES